MDLGCVSDKKIKEFAICDRKFMVGVFSPWNEIYLSEEIENVLSDNKINNNVSAMIGGSDSIKRSISRKYGIPVRSLPFIPDAFNIKASERAFFKEIM